jgi:hypothetical protein
MPAVKFFVRLDLDQIILFVDGHWLQDDGVKMTFRVYLQNTTLVLRTRKSALEKKETAKFLTPCGVVAFAVNVFQTSSLRTSNFRKIPGSADVNWGLAIIYERLRPRVGVDGYLLRKEWEVKYFLSGIAGMQY